MMSFMFKIKPLLDGIYEEMKEMNDEMAKCKKENSELKAELEKLRKVPPPIVMKDDTYAEEAMAPFAAVVIGKDEVKNVTIDTDQQKRDERKEYQRLYRLKRKESQEKK